MSSWTGLGVERGEVLVLVFVRKPAAIVARVKAKGVDCVGAAAVVGLRAYDEWGAATAAGEGAGSLTGPVTFVSKPSLIGECECCIGMALRARSTAGSEQASKEVVGWRGWVGCWSTVSKGSKGLLTGV
jgi:hypothetical protein